MSTPPVYWHQGMFLRPHHFQTAERYWADQVRRSGKYDVHYNWGSRVVRINTDALKNFRFEVTELAARLRDGTQVVAVAGEANALDALDLKPSVDQLTAGQTFDVLLAVPKLQLGQANVGRAGDPSTRFHVEPARDPIDDENDAKVPGLVDVRKLNVRLLTTLQDTTGYETIPLARLERSVKASGEPQLHQWYIPPVLACDGWLPLFEDVIGSAYNRVGGLVKQLAQQVRDQNIRFDSNDPEQRKKFEQLRALNEGIAVFSVIARADGVHPLIGYLELCRLVGKLAAFGKDASLPDELPQYDHDDLGKCFYKVKQYLDDLLSGGVVQGYEQRPFVGDGLKMRVKIEPKWLAPACQVLVGVDSIIPTPECVKLLTGKLNMKIAALERVETVFRNGLKGLEFVHDHKPPPLLPTSGALTHLTYFRVNQNASKEEWGHVAQTYNLAVRINETLVLGTMHERREVTIQADGKTTPMRFTLYVVEPPVQAG